MGFMDYKFLDLEPTNLFTRYSPLAARLAPMRGTGWDRYEMGTVYPPKRCMAVVRHNDSTDSALLFPFSTWDRMMSVDPVVFSVLLYILVGTFVYFEH